MGIFKPLYEYALRWSAHPRAPWYLGGLSFIEAFIFPGAPEIMLLPMTLAKPQNWARYATISLACSMVGSVIGYMMGHYGFELARPLLERLGWLSGIDAYVTQLKALDGWTRDGEAIRKQFTFKGFPEAVAFVTRLVPDAEAADHHPDITINYRRVTLSWSTHDEGGLTAKDIAGARMADRHAREKV